MSHVSVQDMSCRQKKKKKQPKNKVLGGIFLGHQGPRRRDIPDKNFMQLAFFCCFRQGVAGMSRDLGQDVPGLEKLYARKLWADFSFPSHGTFTLEPSSVNAPRSKDLKFVPTLSVKKLA